VALFHGLNGSLLSMTNAPLADYFNKLPRAKNKNSSMAIYKITNP